MPYVDLLAFIGCLAAAAGGVAPLAAGEPMGRISARDAAECYLEASRRNQQNSVFLAVGAFAQIPLACDLLLHPGFLSAVSLAIIAAILCLIAFNAYANPLQFRLLAKAEALRLVHPPMSFDRAIGHFLVGSTGSGSAFHNWTVRAVKQLRLNADQREARASAAMRRK